jgi:hypothetical protein
LDKDAIAVAGDNVSFAGIIDAIAIHAHCIPRRATV